MQESSTTTQRHLRTIEFDKITEKLSELCLSERGKAMALSLLPSLHEAECRHRVLETTGAKTILESMGAPPLSPMKELRKTLQLCEAGAMLAPEQLSAVATFANTCGRLKSYLKRAEEVEDAVAGYGRSLFDLSLLYEEIDLSIRGDQVDDQASPELKALRRKMEASREAVRAKLDSMLRSKREWFSESFIVTRNGRFALPVKKEYKNQVSGTVIDMSSSGSTVFIEPSQARRLTDEFALLHIAEENEIRRILYTLSATVDGYRRDILQNIECMETLDFLFAKARLSQEMDGTAPRVEASRGLRVVNGRHPLLPKEACVPLNFTFAPGVRGVIITGPNTGGKTVALKTVGLLSLMAQSGLHVPAESGSVFCMHANVLADIGDGQSITENLSTFSSHMTNIIRILSETTHESLVLLDELGSGTDPAEGMGLAVSVLEELGRRGCLFVATSHYPEIKDFAAKTPGLTNARMAFDRESLAPLYRLEMGEAGESCALYIAERLGFPGHMLKRAREAAYAAQRGEASFPLPVAERPADPPKPGASQIRRAAPTDAPPRRCDRFQVGDSVRVHPQKDIGIVYRRADGKGLVGVQVQRRKLLVSHQRLQLLVSAEALYPDDYDFSIVFDSVANRKARHALDRKGDASAMIYHETPPRPEER